MSFEDAAIRAAQIGCDLKVPDFDVDLLGHSYFAQAEALLHDIRDLMLHGQAPAKRQRITPAFDGGVSFCLGNRVLPGVDERHAGSGLCRVCGARIARFLSFGSAHADARGFSVTVQTERGRTYQLEYRGGVAEPTWTPLPAVAGDGTALRLRDPTATGCRNTPIHLANR